MNVSEQQFEPEAKKFKWLLNRGYITPKELEFYSNFYEIETTTIINFEGNEVLTPLFILAKPSQFNNIKKELSQAEIADPYSRSFPLISLISIEKFINSLVNLKVPYFFFSLYLHRSYNPPRQVHILLSALIELANISNRYVIKPYNIKIENLSLDEPLSIPVNNELYKVICHFRKMLDNKYECDDSNWWRYNLWNSSETKKTASNTITRKEIEKLALKYNVSPICVHYILIYNKNPCNLSSHIINKIKSHLSSS